MKKGSGIPRRGAAQEVRSLVAQQHLSSLKPPLLPKTFQLFSEYMQKNLQKNLDRRIIYAVYSADN